MFSLCYDILVAFVHDSVCFEATLKILQVRLGEISDEHVEHIGPRSECNKEWLKCGGVGTEPPTHLLAPHLSV